MFSGFSFKRVHAHSGRSNPHLAGQRFSSPRVATGPAHCPHVISGNYLSPSAGIMIYNYNNNNSAIKKNAQPGAGTLAHGAMGKPEPILHLPSLCIHLCFSGAILTGCFLRVGVAVGHLSSDWVPLCKHTHSCISGPSIWRNKETQGHHSCSLSVWLSSDIRHHEAASVETDTVRISCIPHRTESS